jgi:hypothetical protein
MPSDLLVPAFIVTLIANAILIVVAMRGLLTGRVVDEPRPAPPAPKRSGPSAEPVHEVVPRPRATAVPAPQPAAPPADADPPEPAAPSTSTAEAEPAAVSQERSQAIPAPTATMAAATAATVTAAAATSKGTKSGATKSGRRRRFSLPPLDEDHEKVNRSIETFLAGGEIAADRAPTTTPTTVALVSVTGMDTDPISDAIERALRTAARGRGPGRVERVESGRWRIVLTATGELAARSYGHRLRAGVEPLIAATGEPGRVVVATATVLGDSIDVASATAERRLASLQPAETQEPSAAAD